MQPTLGRIVHYRGKRGVQAMRAAMVVMDWDSWVREGDVPALSSPSHVHLWVFTPGEQGGFMEYDVANGEDITSLATPIPPGTWRWPPRV